jgi:hypothetical protein
MTAARGIVEKLIRWFGCIVIVSAAPVILKWLDLLWDSKPVSRCILLGDGELFIVACALAGAGIAETFGLGKLKPLPLAAGVGCVLSVLGTAYAYSHFKNPDHNPLIAANWSIGFFAFTLLAATICVLFGPLGKR